MRTTALVLFVALTAFAAGCGKKPDPAPEPVGGGGPPAPTDKDRLQGVWKVESIDVDLKHRNKPRPNEFKTVRFQFEGDRLTLAQYGFVQSRTTFTLDPSQNPRVMTVTPARGNDPGFLIAVSGEWLYKFEGETLVLAVTKGSGPRPTEFKPHAPPEMTVPVRLQEVEVYTLVKTDEKPVTENFNPGRPPEDIPPATGPGGGAPGGPRAPIPPGQP
jgi:uncharacterized protein (TIGR03067 family)